MNKKLSIAMSLVLAGSALSTTAMAEEVMGLELSANVALTSNYIWRGYTLSDDDFAIQGGFDAAHSSGVYAGVWASSIDQYNDSEIELDTYIGWGGEVGPVGVDVGWVRYWYPGEASPSVETDEYHVGVSTEAGPVGLGVTYNYSPDYFGADDNDYWDFSAEMPVADFTLAAHYGINDGDESVAAGGVDYDDWSVGASTELGGFGFDLTYMDSDMTGADDLWSFTISKSL